MNALARWNTLKEMEELENRLSSLFNLRPARRDSNDAEERMTVAEWAPPVDITEDDTKYVIKADLPEVRKEDLKLTVENGVLTLVGERRLEKEETGLRYHRVERAHGSFARSFTLPDNADPTRVQADFKNGVLAVHVAKDEQAQPKTIQVKIA